MWMDIAKSNNEPTNQTLSGEEGLSQHRIQ
jgi:hypothetical protein